MITRLKLLLGASFLSAALLASAITTAHPAVAASPPLASEFLPPAGDPFDIMDIAVSPDGSTVYLAGYQAANNTVSLWRGSRQWEQVRTFAAYPPGNGDYIVRLAPDNPDVVLMALRGTQSMWFSNDGGRAMWSPRIAYEPIDDLLLQTQSVYYALSGDQVWETTDGGYVWQRVGSDLPFSGANTEWTVSGELLVGGTNGRVAYSVNGRAVWTAIPQALPVPGIVHAAAESLQDGGFIYAVSQSSSSLYRWTIGSSTEWDTVLADEIVGGYGVSNVGGALYAMFSDGSQSVVKRSLSAGAGNPAFVDLMTAAASLTDGPKPLNVSVNASGAKLWFIDRTANEILSYLDETAILVNAGADAIVEIGDSFSSSGSFLDPQNSTCTATVEYGDETGTQALTLAEGNTFSLSYTYSVAGTYSARVTVSSPDGRTGNDRAVVVVRPINRLPIAQAGGPYVFTEPPGYGFGGPPLPVPQYLDASGSSDPDGDVLFYRWDMNSDGTWDTERSANPRTMVTYQDDWSGTARVEVWDGWGVSTDDAAVTVLNVAPTVSAGDDIVLMAPTLFSRECYFFDPGAVDTWTISVNYGDGSPTEAISLPEQYLRVFGLSHMYVSAGSFIVTVSVADDDGGVGTGTFRVNVLIWNTPPYLEAIANKSVNEGQSLSFTVRGSDPQANALSFSTSPLPSGASFSQVNANEAQFSWVPGYSQSGTYTLTFTVSDGSLTDSETITITVANTNRPPELATMGMKQVNEGSPLELLVDAHDPDTDPITITASSLPDGASFEGGEFRWVPSYDQSGTYAVTFTASDGSASDSESLTVTVSNVSLEAWADLDPDSVRIDDSRQWITAYIELPEGANPGSLVLSTIRLTSDINVPGVAAVSDTSYDFVSNPKAYLTDVDRDGVQERMVKFRWSEVRSLLSSGNNTLWLIAGRAGWPDVPDFAAVCTITLR